MADVAAPWQGDLILTPAGDLASVDGSDETRQRIIRRLLTAVQGYVWHQAYGAGLPQRIGNTARPRNIQALCQAQILLEATVAKSPLPVVTVPDQPTVGGLFVIDIQYTDAVTGVAVAISLEVPGR